MKTTSYISVLLLTLSMQAMEDQALVIKPKHLQVASKLGNIALKYDKDIFNVIKNNEAIQVKSYDVDPVLRNIKKDHLKKLLSGGYLKVSQFDNGDYKLSAHARGLGGGWLLAKIFYTVTKGAAYGVVLAAPAAIITGGVAATGGAPAVVGLGTYIGSTTAQAIGVSGPVGAVAGGVAKGLAAAGAAKTTAGLTALAYVGTGWTFMTVAIEAAAIGAGAVGAMIPGPI